MKPKRKADGSTGFECAVGHVHDYATEAASCDLGFAEVVEATDESAPRTLASVPGPGELVLSRHAGEWRHFVDGRPLECGQSVRLATPRKRRTLVRYESTLSGPGCVVMLVFTDGTERFAKRSDRFEWPDSEVKGEKR